MIFLFRAVMNSIYQYRLDNKQVKCMDIQLFSRACTKENSPLVYVLINVVVEQTLGERKKKHAADKKKFEEELEELRSQQEVSGCGF